MADNADIADDVMRLNAADRDRRMLEGYPVAVAWRSKPPKGKTATDRAVIIPDLTTVTKAKYVFLADEKGVDVSDDPWAIAYRDEHGELVVKGWPDLMDKVREVFLAKESLVPC